MWWSFSCEWMLWWRSCWVSLLLRVVPSPLTLWLCLVIGSWYVVLGCCCCGVVDGVHFDLPILSLFFPGDAFFCCGGGSSRITYPWKDLDENLLSMYLLTISSLDILSHRSWTIVYGGWQFFFLQFGNKARELQEASCLTPLRQSPMHLLVVVLC